MGKASKKSDDKQVDEVGAWNFLLQISERAKRGEALGSTGKSERLAEDCPVLAAPDEPRQWRLAVGASVSEKARSMLDLYMPLCVGSRANDLVVAHLGQSLDGRIATSGGVSQFITGEENLLHTHRMRALFDAVVVGVNTAKCDNPRLTTRLASGSHATRVLIDPRCSADPTSGLFVDGAAETLVLCEHRCLPENGAVRHLAVNATEGVFSARDILSTLRDVGLRRIFIEGGGLTVSTFLEAGVLGRLHICVAPMIIGSGRPAIALPEVSDLSESHFLKVRHFSSGSDILFDCELRGNE